MHAHKMHVRNVHAHKTHAYEVHAREAHAYDCTLHKVMLLARVRR